MQPIMNVNVVKPVPTCCHICSTDGSFVLFGLWKSAAESGKQVGCTVALACVHSDPQRDESLSFHWQKCWDSFYSGLKSDQTEERSPQTLSYSVKVSHVGRMVLALVFLQGTPNWQNKHEHCRCVWHLRWLKSQSTDQAHRKWHQHLISRFTSFKLDHKTIVKSTCQIYFELDI